MRGKCHCGLYNKDVCILVLFLHHGLLCEVFPCILTIDWWEEGGQGYSSNPWRIWYIVWLPVALLHNPHWCLSKAWNSLHSAATSIDSGSADLGSALTGNTPHTPPAYPCMSYHYHLMTHIIHIHTLHIYTGSEVNSCGAYFFNTSMWTMTTTYVPLPPMDYNIYIHIERLSWWLDPLSRCLVISHWGLALKQMTDRVGSCKMNLVLLTGHVAALSTLDFGVAATLLYTSLWCISNISCLGVEKGQLSLGLVCCYISPGTHNTLEPTTNDI
jgi:hypothetical protein